MSCAHYLAQWESEIEDWGAIDEHWQHGGQAGVYDAIAIFRIHAKRSSTTCNLMKKLQSNYWCIELGNIVSSLKTDLPEMNSEPLSVHVSVEILQMKAGKST